MADERTSLLVDSRTASNSTGYANTVTKREQQEKESSHIHSVEGQTKEMSNGAPYTVFGSTFARSPLSSKWRTIAIFFMATTVALLIVFIVYLSLTLSSSHNKSDETPEWLAPKPSPSLLSKFKYSTVVSDAAPCVDIGNYIQEVKGGNAIDTAIATMFCVGVFNMHSTGIGGGSLLLYYNRKEQKTYALNFREAAALNATEDMFVNSKEKTSVYGGLAIAVPGEVIGYYRAWQRFGSIEWADILQPMIDRLEHGVIIYPSLGMNIKSQEQNLLQYGSPTLINLLRNSTTGKWAEEGDRLFHPLLLQTFKTLAEEPLAMYNGSLASTVAKEIKKANGIVTENDLNLYEPQWVEPLTLPLNQNLSVHALPPPSSGILCSLILRILSGYHYQNKKMNTLEDMTTYYHRYVEASKFAFAKRSGLGDMKFATESMKELFNNLTDPKFADDLRMKIDDWKTHPESYYEPYFADNRDAGTSHLSVIDADGNAVAMTSTINTEFGSMVMGSETGILYNNEMDDFSTPNLTNYFNLPPSPSNFIKPRKRPMSSMSPLIITDTSNGNVKIVLGASGGSRIISAVSQVASHHIFLHKDIKQSIDQWRLHHQLLPNEISHEDNFPSSILNGLSDRGHKIGKKMGTSVTQGLNLGKDGYFYGNADFRKNGKSDGA